MYNVIGTPVPHDSNVEYHSSSGLKLVLASLACPTVSIILQNVPSLQRGLLYSYMFVWWGQKTKAELFGIFPAHFLFIWWL